MTMLSRLLKCFGMKDIKTVVDVYPLDGDMAKIKQDPLSIGLRNIDRKKKKLL